LLTGALGDQRAAFLSFGDTALPNRCLCALHRVLAGRSDKAFAL
jgi:hypothetical protein